MFRRIPLGRVLGSFPKRGKEEGRKDHHKRRESKGKKRKAGKEEKKKGKGGGKGGIKWFLPHYFSFLPKLLADS